MEDLIQSWRLKIAAEGMKAEIIKAFDVVSISSAIKQATEKAVEKFDMASYIERAVEAVFDHARDKAIEELAEKYGHRWTSDLGIIIDEKIKQALEGK